MKKYILLILIVLPLLNYSQTGGKKKKNLEQSEEEVYFINNLGQALGFTEKQNQVLFRIESFLNCLRGKEQMVKENLVRF